MGKVLSVVSRKANRFNAENRAHRFLDKEKLPPAPKYESSYEDMQRTLAGDPEFLERANKKDSALDNRLKEVFVTSENKIIQPEIWRTDAEGDKPLPLNRSVVQDFEYGFKEPNKVTIGRCTLRQVMKFLSDNQAEPTVFTSAKIANDYKIKQDRVEKILIYFKSFRIHIPDESINKKILQQPNMKTIESKNVET